ncbi:hypothetical protein Taro_016220 [Colocasia esculenta]|uniref:DCD domain-containing protein n=1 Tax=Colocasia esculenta TaxID=4460 RepID=A0A843UJR6_COLES|nr:hypothetical protein [Colocasia esculenta]
MFRPLGGKRLLLRVYYMEFGHSTWERKLYGVFEATSDGAMDIVPMAFSSSGKLFSAQMKSPATSIITNRNMRVYVNTELTQQ